jgi:hypothetical protein
VQTLQGGIGNYALNHEEHVNVFDLDCPQCQASEGFMEALAYMCKAGSYRSKNERAKLLLRQLIEAK